MFDQLMESRPHRERSTAQALTSIVVHTAIIAVSIQLTRAVAATVTKTTPETEVFMMHAPVPKVPQAAATAAPAHVAPPLPATLPAPIAVPITIPLIERSRGFDPAQLGRPGESHGLPPGTGTGNPAVDPHYLAVLNDVDDAVEYLDGPAPRYPAALRQVGIEGWVQLRYIVGIDGIAEAGSILVQHSSNASFEAPAIEAIRLSRFKPARIKGRKVRQVVEQVVRFTLH